MKKFECISVYDVIKVDQNFVQNQKNEDLVDLRFSTRKQCFSNKNLGIWSLEHYQNREVLIMYFDDT